MSRMEVDDVVDLSMGRDSMTLTQETVRDLQALSQNSGLTITPAPAASAAAAAVAAAVAAVTVTANTSDGDGGADVLSINNCDINRNSNVNNGTGTDMNKLQKKKMQFNAHHKNLLIHRSQYAPSAAASYRTKILRRSTRYRTIAGENQWSPAKWQHRFG